MRRVLLVLSVTLVPAASYPFVVRTPGCWRTRGAISLSDAHRLLPPLLDVNFCHIIFA